MFDSEINPTSAARSAGFYDDFWLNFSRQPASDELTRALFIRDSIAELVAKTGLEILDLGCGRGWMAPFLSPFGSVTGVDFSPVGIEFAQEKN